MFLLGQILQAVKDAGMWENSVIMLSSDHGGINKGHGGKTMVGNADPWIIYAEKVSKKA